MQAKKKISSKLGSLVALSALALTWGMTVPQAKAQENPRESAPETASAFSNPNASKSSGKRYFVEFRSRAALSYGHAFLVHGKLNAQGEVGQVTPKQVAGLHPFSESSIPWSVGHVVPVIAEHGWTDGDTEDEYITARYRVLLTEPEYNDVVAFIDKLNKKTPLWHAVAYNCESFIGDVAKYMGLKAPPSTLVFPDEYIKTMAELNGGTVKMLPSATAAAAPAKPKPKPAVRTAKPATTPAAAKPAAAPATAKPAGTAKPTASAAPAVSSETTAYAPAVQPERY